MPDDLHVIQRPQLDPRLGRQVVHDPRSWRFELPRQMDLPRRSFRHRVWDPVPRPNQKIGCRTGVDQCVKANTRGNRVLGKILRMPDAVRVYSRSTEIDAWQGSYPPEDTGSSGLAACKAAMEFGWHSGMFDPEPGTLLVEPTGGRVGGHQYTLIGWDRGLDAFELTCWWDNWANGLARIRRQHLAALLADDGDAHVTYRRGANG